MRSPKRDRVFSGEQEKIWKAWRPLMHLPPQRATAAYLQLRDEVGKRAIPPRCGSAWRDSSPLEKAEPLDLPAITATEDLPPAFAALVAALARGDLTPDEAQAVATLLEQHRRVLETAYLERVRALEERWLDESEAAD